ncbi:MAG: nitroreductase [Gammaproteobacteria bacterium]|jgi:nitroreductase
MNDNPNLKLDLLWRSSTPAKFLYDPAPDDKQLAQVLTLAMRAPDHGRIRPYRFITIRGDARYKLSEVFGDAVKQRNPEVSAVYLKKQMDKPLRSPLIVVVVASVIESPKIPKIEQILCAGAAAHGILLASNALGFGSVWLTGDNAYDPVVFAALGLADNEEIIGFIYLGSEISKMPERPPANLADHLSDWS